MYKTRSCGTSVPLSGALVPRIFMVMHPLSKCHSLWVHLKREDIDTEEVTVLVSLALILPTNITYAAFKLLTIKTDQISTFMMRAARKAIITRRLIKLTALCLTV